MVELDPGRPEHVKRPPGRIAERVVGEEVGFDHEPVEGAGERPAPRSAELVLLLRIPVVLIGESRTFAGVPERMREGGVEVVDLDDPRCIGLMEEFIRTRPELWNEDIGVADGGSASYVRP